LGGKNFLCTQTDTRQEEGDWQKPGEGNLRVQDTGYRFDSKSDRKLGRDKV
jgi:hypothetical protein